MSELLDGLLAKPIGPTVAARTTDPEKDFTRQIEVKGDAADVTVRAETFEQTESAATDVLRNQGLDPAEWTVTGFRSSEWTMASGDTGVSTRFSFARTKCATVTESGLGLDELLAAIDSSPVLERDEQAASTPSSSSSATCSSARSTATEWRERSAVRSTA